MSKTIDEVATELRTTLIEYIEATYHIADPAILAQRRALLEELGVIHQAPYLESTPRYQTGPKFDEIKGLPKASLQVLEALAQPLNGGKPLFYDPPYTHQSDSISRVVVDARNVLIMTGTGSGKTESFLMPILAKLAREAAQRPDSFREQRGMRALILYPMNALVNDQLGRLRAIFGDPRLRELFMTWSSRLPRFARYTSRTPYAGRREKSKDQRRLKPFGDFYVKHLEDLRSDEDEVKQAASKLITQLTERGKWPAKPDLERWYNGPGKRKLWQDADENFLRAVALEEDSELLTRHEVQTEAPDLLVTNYSMLEYMLMRPIERTIFDQTKDWLNANPSEKFLIVLDEAHLYRGAQGAEVGLLLRRLRDRLDIAIERFQVICATASFESKTYAPTFASRLTGAPESTFEIIDGAKRLREGQAPGTPADAVALSNIPLDEYYSAEPKRRSAAVKSFLAHLGAGNAKGALEAVLFKALEHYPPLSLLVNKTMGTAQAVATLGTDIFPGVDKEVANRAVTALGALASNARKAADEPSLLPCRVHTFFRGLRGLWACMDPNCSAVPAEHRGTVGKLFTQPKELCECGARILEYFTCRVCGSAYGRAYCDDPQNPTVISREPGAVLHSGDEHYDQLAALDLLLVSPHHADLGVAANYDLVSGHLNSSQPGPRQRRVYLPPNRVAEVVDDEEDGGGTYAAEAGIFKRCGVCERIAYQGRSSVQDHETKGDQPFQVLLNRQLQVQAPNAAEATRFAPLRGRKVLAFSDSRQVAARLAPNLQMYSSRDSLRPLLVRGWTRLAAIPGLQMRMADVYSAVLIAACELKVRLRPELDNHEAFSDYPEVARQVAEGILTRDDDLKALCVDLRGSDGPPKTLLADILSTLRDRLLGLEALALGSIAEHADRRPLIARLPAMPGIAETPEDKVGLARAWLRGWTAAGFHLPRMNEAWYAAHPDAKVRISTKSGKFQRLDRALGSPAARATFKKKWLPELLGMFTQQMSVGAHRLDGQRISLEFGGKWVRCADCKSVHRPLRLIPRCLDCSHSSTIELDPDNDPVFSARKGFYRRGVMAALGPEPEVPMSIVAAEHTAQLNSAQTEEVFSRAEQHELLFQDVEFTPPGSRMPPSAIDVLSSTTTMEVGIDIGQLSGVALRNMPPGRANYQQRAGRAGRRGNAVASVLAFGGSDTHDEHFFREPAQMIAGQVVDPLLCLENKDIAKRHVRAFLLQCFHQAKIPSVQGTSGNGSLFSVLGDVSDFLRPGSVLSLEGLKEWLEGNEHHLRERVDGWLPEQLAPQDRAELLDGMVEDCLAAIHLATRDWEPTAPRPAPELDDIDLLEAQDEPDEVKPAVKSSSRGLLDTLLYHGVLPRYAFPTDVATFHVFDPAQSTHFLPKLVFAPSQSLPIALTQYAPDKQIWIAGKCYTSGAIYSPFRKDLKRQWDERLLHAECRRCGYARTWGQGEGVTKDQMQDCIACQGPQTLGPARHWMRPTGFAHPVDIPPVTSPDDIPETSYATRAKLTMASPGEGEWIQVNERIRYVPLREHLMVSNTGPAKDGYAFCTSCGRIEAATNHAHSRLSGRHPKPFPDEQKPNCEGGFIAKHVVLGTTFPTDVALFSLRLGEPILLKPGDTITTIALRTLCEALSRAACLLLEIEPGEVLAEFRPALSNSGVSGQETEVFLYDTLSGGAGFATAAAQRGEELFTKALEIMSTCPQGADCDFSCYRCLRTFRNRIDHSAIDRHTGEALARYLLTGVPQPFDARRLRGSGGLLFSDLLRRNVGGLSPDNQEELVIDDLGRSLRSTVHGQGPAGGSYLVAVISPLEIIQPSREMNLESGGPTTLIEVSELMVRRNPAQAAALAISEIART
jgi:ATP-dependent helicase YprA (DUF1998 family)